MKLTKDDCRVLSAAIHAAKHELTDQLPGTDRMDTITALDNLAAKFDQVAKDGRRKGRKSHDDWNDCLARFRDRHLSTDCAVD